jgi:DNA primase
LTVYIPEEKISEIKQAANIVDIVSEGVALKKAGKNYLGLCPFHSEKTPSFSVSPEKQIFYCFGCGAGGNVFSFMMKREAVSFPEAARALSKRYGIELPTQSMSPEQKRRISEREDLLAINRQALNFFNKSLIETQEGKKATSYLARRGISPEIVERFNVGFAPKSWDRLTHFFSKKRVSLGLVEKSGLIVLRHKNNGYYDRFRGRIIFPIFDSSAQLIGFGGRVLDDSSPKYLNSPETRIYNKRRSLYGIHLAKNRCRERELVYIVEGYLDLLALHQHGIDNSVATLGTSLTGDHARLLRGLVGTAGKVILVFDSDEAGIKAAHRCIEVFDKEYVNALIIVLPAGHDPDSYLLKFGVDSFHDSVSNRAIGIMTFLIDLAVKKYGLSLEGKIQILSDLQKPLAMLNDNVERSLYIKELSERINIDEAAILEKVRALSGDRQSEYPDNKNQVKSAFANQNRENRLERRIVAMMLQYPAIISEIKKQGVLDHFEDKNLKSIGEIMLNFPKDSKIKASDIISLIEDKKQRALVAALAMGDDLWDHAGCFKLIRQLINSKDRRTNSLLNKIKSAENGKDYELLNKLLKEKQVQARKGNI